MCLWFRLHFPADSGLYRRNSPDVLIGGPSSIVYSVELDEGAIGMFELFMMHDEC